MKNTILETTNAKSIVAEVQMLHNTVERKSAVFILVEGLSDKKLYTKFFRKDKVYIESANSSKKLIAALNLVSDMPMLSDITKGIIDADFRHLIVDINNNRNLFITDVHDSEMLMLKCPSVVRALCDENCYDGEADELCNAIMIALKPLSYLKYYNFCAVRNNPRLTSQIIFKGFSISNCYDGECSQDLANWRNAIFNYSNNRSNSIFPSLTILQKFIDDNQTDDLYNLTNGHDLSEGLRIKFSSKTNKNLESRQLESQMRVSYTFNDFKTTDLFKEIDAWATDAGLSIWVTC